MHTYKSRCRFNQLIAVDGQVIEIRPQEVFTSKSPVISKYLEEIKTTPIRIKSKTKVKAVNRKKVNNGTSSGT